MSTFPSLPHSILIIMTQCVCYCFPHLTDDETEAQRVHYVFSSEPHSYSLTESGLEHRSVSPKSQQVKEPQEMLSPFPLLSDPGANHTDKGRMIGRLHGHPGQITRCLMPQREEILFSALKGKLGKAITVIIPRSCSRAREWEHLCPQLCSGCSSGHSLGDVSWSHPACQPALAG